MLLEPEVGGWTKGAEVERGGRPNLRETENSTEGLRDGWYHATLVLRVGSLRLSLFTCPCSQQAPSQCWDPDAGSGERTDIENSGKEEMVILDSG